jgi:predicted amidohydrolase
MQLACCQFDIAWEDKPANFRKVTELVRGARLEPGALLLLPEMFGTGFSMNTAVTAEAAEGPTWRFLADLAREHRTYVLAGVALSRGDTRPRNEALVFGPDGRYYASYAKVHLFKHGTEDQHYAAGDAVLRFNWGPKGGCAVAPRICYDLRFPELFRRDAAEGAELLTVIANWPVTRQAHWVTLLRARAIENQSYVGGCNRVGRDGNGLEYAGGSQIIDFGGHVLADAGAEETVISATVDPAALREYRTKLPFLADMRR